MRGIVAQLTNLKEPVSENCLIGAILSALPESFGVFIMVWKNSNNSSVDDLVSKLMAEAHDQISKEKNEDTALAAEGYRKGKGGSEEYDKDQYAYCKEKRHWIRECPNLKEPYDSIYRRKGEKQDNKQSSTSKDKDSTTDVKELAFMTQVEVNNKSMGESEWVGDLSV